MINFKANADKFTGAITPIAIAGEIHSFDLDNGLIDIPDNIKQIILNDIFQLVIGVRKWSIDSIYYFDSGIIKVYIENELTGYDVAIELNDSIRIRYSIHFDESAYLNITYENYNIDNLRDGIYLAIQFNDNNSK